MAEYIEKQAALKAVCDACGIVPDIEKENCQYKFVGCEEYYNVFDLPLADVRPVVRGHWERAKGDSRFMCSVCKGKEHVPTIMGQPTVWEYCPNCGAWMKGGEFDD